MASPKKEASKHSVAFELFYALGADRTFSEVGKRMDVSGTAVGVWAQCFRWRERIAAREKIVSDLVAQKAVEDEAQSRADALKICRASIINFAQTLKPIKDPITGAIIKPASADIKAADFVNLVKLEQFLRGKPSERSELMIGGPAFDKLIDAIAAVVEREVSDPALRARLAAGFTEAAAGLGTVGNA